MSNDLDGRSLAIAASASLAVTTEIEQNGGDVQEVCRALTWTLCLLAASTDAPTDQIVAEFRSSLEAERRARLAQQSAN
jgi:hypothetical protein